MGQFSWTREFVLKFKMESEPVLTQSERDTVCIVIKSVHVIRSLLCGVVSRLTSRGRREILVTGYNCCSRVHCSSTVKLVLLIITQALHILRGHPTLFNTPLSNMQQSYIRHPIVGCTKKFDTTPDWIHSIYCISFCTIHVISKENS